MKAARPTWKLVSEAAALLSHAAVLCSEFADKLRKNETSATPRLTRPAPRIRRPASIDRPSGESDELAAARAKRLLRQQAGYIEGDGR